MSDLRPAKDFAQQFSGVYAIINILDDKHYIGSALNFKKRWYWHSKDLRRGVHRNSKLQHAWNKHGETNFIFVKLQYCHSNKLVSNEQAWLDKLEPEYNIARVAGNSLGVKRSDKTRQKQSILKLGKALTPEHRLAIGNGNKGRKVSQKTIDKLRERSIGNTFSLGYKQTDTAKLAIAKAHKGKPKSAEHRKKISETLKRRNELRLFHEHE